jgi:hypothetical protein
MKFCEWNVICWSFCAAKSLVDSDDEFLLSQCYVVG